MNNLRHVGVSFFPLQETFFVFNSIRPKKKNRDHADSEDSARLIFSVTQRFLSIPETKILLGPQKIRKAWALD